MGRRRPGTIRATQRIPQWAREGGPIDRLPPATIAAVRAAEHSGRLDRPADECASYDPDPFREHVRPGRTAAFLRDYRKFLRRPGRRLRLEASLCPSCPGCRYDDLAVVRDALEAVARLLPAPARAEFRRLLTRLDDDLRARTMPDSFPRACWNGQPLPWWHRRIYRN